MTIAEENEQKAQQLLAAKAKLGLDIERLQRLLDNEDFQWWMTEHVQPRVKQEHEAAHAVAKDIADSVTGLRDDKLKNLQAMAK